MFYRAKSFCPACFTEEELWVYNGNSFPRDSHQCNNCGLIYPQSDFILSFLEQQGNATLSSTMSHVTSNSSLLQS